MNFIILITCFSIAISGIAAIFISIRHKKCGPLLYSLFIINVFLLLGMIYPTLTMLASEQFYEQEIALFFYKCSIIVVIVSLGLINSLYSFILEYKRSRLVPILIICLIGGMLIGEFFNPNSIKIYKVNNYYLFQFDELSLFLTLSLEIFLIIYIWYSQIKAFSNLQIKKFAPLIMLFTIVFTFALSFHFLYILTQEIFFRDISFFLLLIGESYGFYAIVKKPNLFLLVSHKIESITVFHKSGILLYSYNFQAREELHELLLKGSILIGINHILSDFIGKKDKLNLLKMKDRYVIFDYDNIYGFAVMLISNQMNNIIVNAVNQFMQEFTSVNKDNLKELITPKRLIDISKFHNTSDIINDSFQLFLD